MGELGRSTLRLLFVGIIACANLSSFETLAQSYPLKRIHIN